MNQNHTVLSGMSLFGRRKRREIAELNEYVDKLRRQRDKALRAQETAEFNRAQVLAQNADLNEKYADACIANECLTRDLAQLQRRLDDAVGLKAGGVEDSRPWQSGHKKAGAS